MKAIFPLFILLAFPFFLNAQLEASVWSLGYGQQILFQNGNAVFNTNFQLDNPACSTICDEEGNLLLVTNGFSVWNQKNEVLENGTNLIEDRRTITPGTRPFFIPHPGKPGFYYLLYETCPSGGYRIGEKQIVFALIDVNAENGKGKVLDKNVLLHDDYHRKPTICGFCDNSYFWILVDRNDNVVQSIKRDRMYLYKIDEDGIHQTPVINDDFNMGHSGSYRFSPNGDKFFFYYSENVSGGFPSWNIANFNFQTGEIYYARSIKYEPDYVEFSPNSSFLYFFHENRLIQFQVDAVNGMNYEKKSDTLLTLPYSEDVTHPGSDLQLAPDGKIYFYYYDLNTKQSKIGRINNPNYKGAACNVETDVFVLEKNYHSFFPEFVTSFFRDKNSEKIDPFVPDAGPDIRLCSDRKLPVGKENQPEAIYHWVPETGFENPFSPATVYNPQMFVRPDPEIRKATLIASDGNCWMNTNEIEITLLPVPYHDRVIDGSYSVCPFVEKVDYWTYNAYYWDANEGTELNWLVGGGSPDKITHGNDTDTLKVNWNETNAEAWVGAFAVNKYSCYSDTIIFPVRVNVELLTPTPKGPDNLCVKDRQNINYFIQKTNGSEYDWFIDGGIINRGQGTNSVDVSWTNTGTNRISVKETSVTSDTVCFGESLPLLVNVINDSLQIELRSVSIDENGRVVFTYGSEKLQKIKPK